MNENRSGRAWTRNGINELLAAVNAAASVLEADDDMAEPYVRNALASVAKANEFLLRAKVHFENAAQAKKLETVV